MATPEQQEILDALAEAADELEVFLPERCAIVRSTEVSDGAGGTSVQWLPTALDEPCRVSVARAGSATERVVAARLVSVIPYDLSLRKGVDVTNDDRIVVSTGRTFEVHGVPEATYSVFTKAACSEET